MTFDVPFPVAFTIVAAGFYFTWYIYQRKIQRVNKMRDIPDIIPATGFEVPVLATFIGLKILPRQAAHAHNSAFPSLTLFEDRIECLVLKKKVFYYPK